MIRIVHVTYYTDVRDRDHYMELKNEDGLLDQEHFLSNFSSINIRKIVFFFEGELIN